MSIEQTSQYILTKIIHLFVSNIPNTFPTFILLNPGLYSPAAFYFILLLGYLRKIG